jgi:hypothetical protein
VHTVVEPVRPTGEEITVTKFQPSQGVKSSWVPAGGVRYLQPVELQPVIQSFWGASLPSEADYHLAKRHGEPSHPSLVGIMIAANHE